jgi:phosphoglycolate phosphatase-like HAD superfamily hydrolase
VDQPPADRSTLALFDFDGTLVDLATDYLVLRSDLTALGGGEMPENVGLLQTLLNLYAIPDRASEAATVVDRAELGGLLSGQTVTEGTRLYRHFSEHEATIAIATHNGRAVVERFLTVARLAAPDTIFDLRALGASKQKSVALRDYVARNRAGRCYVVGNAESDRALAVAISANYIDVNDP